MGEARRAGCCHCGGGHPLSLRLVRARARHDRVDIAGRRRGAL